MSWLWQGIIITVVGGVILAIILSVSKAFYTRVEYAKKLTQVKIKHIEDSITTKRKTYKSASSFYIEFANATWIRQIPELSTISNKNKKILKSKWIKDADFTISYDRTNIDLMRLQFVANTLKKKDLESIIDKPTKDSFGNDQAAGVLIFMQFMQTKYPHKITNKVANWIENEEIMKTLDII
jgi:hypothetical protein